MDHCFEGGRTISLCRRGEALLDDMLSTVDKLALIEIFNINFTLKYFVVYLNGFSSA